MNKIATSIVGLCLATTVFGQVKQEYLPAIHGTVRGKYEFQTATGENRFMVRNARLSLTGNVHPSVAYKMEIDLADEGAIKMLDAYVRVFPVKDVYTTLGHQRVPFGIDVHRSPHQQYFANRSFLAKQVGNVRDVGVAAGYAPKKGFPFVVEGGLFNGTGLTKEKEWRKSVNYAFKAQLLPNKHWNFTLSTQMIKPEQVCIHLYDAGIYYHADRFHIEAEYLYKTYVNDAFKDVHALNGFINYDVPLKKTFSKISFLARYDRMTDHSNGVADSHTGALTTTDYARHRVTGGITLSLSKAFTADLRLNVEKYFYRSGAVPKASEQDKFVVEFMTRF